ncbi:MAG: 3-hydroxyacyl-CoA dehydrogenase/enoyl-CoA hydratase family protein, partial [Flavobacteriales bacterium]
MAYKYLDLNVEKLSVIGAGQIGPDICLHFAKVFWQHRVQLILIDISDEALGKAKNKIEKKIGRGVESGAFKPEMAEAMKNSITYTSDYNLIAGSAIVLEAATEDEKVKELIFKQVEEITDDNCLFFSNSSHMEPEVIFKHIANKGRCLVTHYFFPAERNPVVEVVPGKETDSTITDTLLGFYEAIGKVPIRVKSSYGYAIDPIFEGLCELAILCLEKGYGTVKEIDKMAQRTLGLGVGPFTALNLTGGNPITNHGLEEMRKTHIPWFRSPKALQEATASGNAWETAGRDEEVKVPEDKAETLRKQFLGGYFALASHIVDRGISNVNDLDMATSVALVIKPPFSMMNKMGIETAHALTKEWCAEHTEFPFPAILDRARAEGGWKVSNIMRSVKDGVALLTIRRPQVLNALNLTVIEDLTLEVEKAGNDDAVKAIVITGFGTKAFVSGADINMIAGLKTAEDGYNNSRTFQQYINRIADSAKPVVCALNGFAFCGG